MKRDVTAILATIEPAGNEALNALPAIQRLVRMRSWMEHRLWRRARVRIPVAVVTNSGQCIANCVDIAARGLGLSGVNGLNAGQRITVTLRGFESLKGRVVWAKGKRAGVLLDQNLLG